MAQEIETGIDGQAMQPGIEPVRVTQPGQVPPGSDERVLDRIARQFAVPLDQPGGRVQARDGEVDEHGEGVMIARRCSLHVASLVHGVPADRAT